MLTYEVLYFVTQSVAGFELFVGVLYDQTLKDNLQMFEVHNDALRKYMSSLDSTMFTLFHPEFGYYSRACHTSTLVNFSADMHFVVLDAIESYSLDIPLSIAIQLFLVVYFVIVLTSFFFAFYNSVAKEE